MSDLLSSPARDHRVKLTIIGEAGAEADPFLGFDPDGQVRITVHTEAGTSPVVVVESIAADGTPGRLVIHSGCFRGVRCVSTPGGVEFHLSDRSPGAMLTVDATAQSFTDHQGGDPMTNRPDMPSSVDLWRQSGGDREEYRRLLREHGMLVDGPPEPLPCGWTPGGRRSSLGEQRHAAEHCDRGGEPHLGPCVEPGTRTADTFADEWLDEPYAESVIRSTRVVVDRFRPEGDPAPAEEAT